MPFRPSTRQIEYIVALDETRHFGSAARRCHVSQPTLSVQVALLEKQLGAVLFERTPGNVRPTPIGEQVISLARVGLASLDDIVAVAALEETSLGGLIRLGTAPTFGPYFLPAFLSSVHRAFPKLQIYIREEGPALLEASVLDGLVDCGLGPEPQAPHLAFRRLCDEPVYLGVSGDHPLAGMSSVPVRRLAGERLLTLGKGHRLFENVRRLSIESGASLVEDYEGTSLDAIRQMVSIGMGISLFPELYTRSEFRKEGNVVRLPIKDWDVQRTIGFFWREKSGRARHFETLAAEADKTVATMGLG